MNQGMTIWGWSAFILGWGLILALSLYSLSRVLFGKKKIDEDHAGAGVSRERWATRIGLVLAMAGIATAISAIMMVSLLIIYPDVLLSSILSAILSMQ